MTGVNLLSLDLEINKSTGSIIQVGAVVGNLATGEILNEYSAYIKVNEKIDEYIKKLTGIKQEDVDYGISLQEAYFMLTQLHNEYKTFRNPITWGGGDSELLRKQLNLDNETFLFGRRWIDAKTLFVSYRFANDEDIHAGLAKALLKLGLEFKGKKHNALDDARNTFFIYRQLLSYFIKDI